MRLAAFNVENLFDRAKAFNDTDGAHSEVLDAHAELGKLFEKTAYGAADKARMLELLDRLGMLNRDEGRYTRLRRIRGAADPAAPRSEDTARDRRGRPR